MRDNELLDGKNFVLDELGRIVKRFGMQAYGDRTNNFQFAGTFFNANAAGANPVAFYIADASNNVYRLVTTNTTNAITTASTTIDIDAGGDFAASGNVEIEGDIIAYTGLGAGSTSLTGVTGITSNHAAGAPVHQWVAGSGVTTTALGVYTATLNDNFFLNSSGVYYEDDHTTASFATASGSPVILFLTTFKTRLYGAGDGSASGRAVRVFYSNLNDGTAWTPASDYFDVEDSRNEPITGLKDYRGNLMIFKANSIHRYNLASLRQTNGQVGAYNHYVVQEINNLLYTFCPSGIFVTNGVSARDIGEPVKEFWKNFQPTFDATYSRRVNNCSAGRYKHWYLLYVGDVTRDDGTTLSDVVLVFDTIRKNWSVYDGFTDLINFIPLDLIEDNEDQPQYRPRLFFTSTSLGSFISFDNRTLDGTTVRGGDLTQDMFRDTGTPVTMSVITKPYDLGYSNWRKQFGYLKVFADRPGVHLSYKIDDNDPVPLGIVDKKIKRFQFPSDAKGYRCSILIDESSLSAPVIYNGHTFEECSLIDKNA